jgi:RNA polymerase sigma-70 factor (ECF subfamily)
MPDEFDATIESDASKSIGSSLLQRVREQDVGAWDRLVHLYSPLIYDWCRGQGLQPADSADVMQETFCAVSANIENFRWERPGDSFRGWLWTIARNKIRDHYRRRFLREEAAGGTNAFERIHEIPDGEPKTSGGSASGRITNNPYHRATELVRLEFEDRTWQAFYQVAIDARATADVAADLGISVNAVRKAKSRVLRRLREEFGELLH